MDVVGDADTEFPSLTTGADGNQNGSLLSASSVDAWTLGSASTAAVAGTSEKEGVNQNAYQQGPSSPAAASGSSASVAARLDPLIADRFKLLNPQTPYHLFVAGKVQAARLKQAVTARERQKQHSHTEEKPGDESPEVHDAIRRINDIWDKHAVGADIAAIESRLDDIINRATLEYLQSITPELYAVRGEFDTGKQAPQSLRIEEEGLRVGLTSGYSMVPSLGDVDTLAATARQMDVDILVTGSTHRFEAYEEQGRFFINPGSITGAFSPMEAQPIPSFVLMEMRVDRELIAYVYQLVNDEVVVDRIEYRKERD
ncbi:Vacuolar protein sorting-associated protein 29 [Coemansia brasiliensis]|uniref:Vacuolar protein sorting-associated protein 29 n=1 Tax=Coemansia brasiliensis TaxID=2650707 RepID=A0A9W8I2U6_9FUNG|nr:Vacuolar protein sorting-associated protein 29 [Coemansia brasiliensis]